MLTAKLNQSVLPRPAQARFGSSAAVRIVARASMPTSKTWVRCDMIPMGSSLKFCVIAEGGADLYPRLGLTSEWDTAAAQAVVEQAGGSVVTLDGKPMKYNTKEDMLNPFFFVIGAADRDWLALLPDSE